MSQLLRWTLPATPPQHIAIETCVRCGRGASIYCASHDRYLCECPGECFDKHHFSTHSTCELVSVIGEGHDTKVPIDRWTKVFMIGAALFIIVTYGITALVHWGKL